MAERIVEAQEDFEQPRGFSIVRMLVWVVILGFLGLSGWQLINTGRVQPNAGLAPDFTLTTYSGEEIALADLRGQVVVVNFWASWCVPCRDEAPALESVWQAYKDDGVMFIGIGYLDSEAKALEFMEEFGMTYPNGADKRQVISDDYRITGVPETFIIDPEGNITFHAALPINEEILVREIEKARAGS